MSKHKHKPTRLKEIRVAKGLSTAALGAMVGITQSGISRIENGKVPTTVDMLHRISAALDVKIHDFFDEGSGSSHISIERGRVEVKALLITCDDAKKLIAQLSAISDMLQADTAPSGDLKVVEFKSRSCS